MHDSVLRFVRTSTRELGPGIEVLDVGAWRDGLLGRT